MSVPRDCSCKVGDVINCPPCQRARANPVPSARHCSCAGDAVKCDACKAKPTPVPSARVGSSNPLVRRGNCDYCGKADVLDFFGNKQGAAFCSPNCRNLSNDEETARVATKTKEYGGEHYKVVPATYEPIKIIEVHKLNFNKASALSYILRAEHKGQRDSDLEKAINFLWRERYGCWRPLD